MTPIPFADSPRMPDLRPDGDARPRDDRPDAGPEAFLAALGLIAGHAAPDPAGRRAGVPAPAGRTGAGAPAPVPPALTAQPAGIGAGTGGESAVTGTEGPAPAAPASPQEPAFLVAHRSADPAGGGGDGGESGDPAPAADPAPPADGAASGGDGRGSEGQGSKGPGAGEAGPTASLHPARQRGAGTVVTCDGAAPAGGDPGPPPKEAAAEPPEAATLPAAKPGGRGGTNVAGAEPSAAVDPFPLTPDAIAEATTGADPAGGTRGVDRPQAAATNPAPLPAGFGLRLAEAVAHFPDRAVELTLTPEELGRVRMTLSTQDGVLALSIQADRPETIDLMRRHIDQLAQDFREIGFTDLSFNFGRDDTARSESPDRHGDADTGRPATDTVGRPAQIGDSPPGNGGHGLDLRL